MMELTEPVALRKLVDALISINRDLELPVILERIIDAAMHLADARYGAIGILDHSRPGFAEFLTVGIEPAQAAALFLDHPAAASAIGVPIAVRQEVFGNLYLAEKRNGAWFTDADEEMAEALAQAAGVVIENARLHARIGELMLVEDRERIAKDLHDTVIQRLFATGLSLQATAQLTERPEVRARIHDAVDDLDTTVKQIRTAIFGLEASQTSRQAFRRRALLLTQELSGTLGFLPEVVFVGPVDTAISDTVAGELLATMREALSNIARHAAANAVRVEVRAGSEIGLRISDDGRGLPVEPPRGFGLRNMASRAAALGGRFTARRRNGGGTVVEWAVPTTA